MGDFRIPFTETEEEKLFFGFSVREATTIFAGILAAVIVGLLVFVLCKKLLITATPAVFVLPGAYWAAKGRLLAVKDDKDCKIPVVEFFLKRNTATKPKSYINFTRGE